MNTLKKPFPHTGFARFRDIVAALSSIIPGLGHIYKGQYKTGLELLILSPFFIWIGLILGWATAGLGLLVPVLYMLAAGWHAYFVEDKRHHPAGVL